MADKPPIPPERRGLPRRQAQFLDRLAFHTSLNRRDYQLLAGISHTTARQDLASLLAAGLICRLGRARAVRYTLALETTPESRNYPAPIE